MSLQRSTSFYLASDHFFMSQRDRTISPCGSNKMSSQTSLRVAQALIVSLTTTRSKEQFRKIGEIATCFFNEQDVAIHNTIAKNGALTPVTARLMQAMERDPLSTEDIFPLSDLLTALLRCDSQWTVDFLTNLGIPLLARTISCLSELAYANQHPESLYRFLSSLASLPWSNLPKKDYKILVRILQQALRTSSANDIFVTSMYFLSEMADDVKQKQVLVEHPGLVEDVLDQLEDFLRNGPHEMHHRSVLFSCRFLKRLAWGPKNTANLARSSKLMKALSFLARNEELGVVEEALQVITLMSTDCQSRRFVAKHEDAAIIKHLVGWLDHPVFGEAALRALSGLVDTDSAKRLASYQGFFHSLALLASGGQGTHTVKAAQVLKRLASHVSVRDDGHKELLDALISCARSSSRLVRSWAAKGLLVQSESSANAFFLARTQYILNVVTALCRDRDSSVRTSAIQTLLNAASEASNTRRAACTTQYLSAFINGAEHNEGADSQSLTTTRLSIKGILKLSDHPKSYRRVAKQNGAIEALARYGVSSDSDCELKGAALHAVVILSPFL